MKDKVCYKSRHPPSQAFSTEHGQSWRLLKTSIGVPGAVQTSAWTPWQTRWRSFGSCLEGGSKIVWWKNARACHVRVAGIYDELNDTKWPNDVKELRRNKSLVGCQCSSFVQAHV